MTTSRIHIGESTDSAYDVVVGRELMAELPAILTDAHRVAIVHQPAVRAAAQAMREYLRGAGFEAHVVEIPDGEAAKSVKVARFCWEVLGKAGFTRSDAVIGFGGGAATDLAGFVAATWLRGVRVVQVPTTLLGMVDAAVGGKTGINTAAGKNLVGVFHPPVGVLVDLDALSTLPSVDLFAGMAEVVKCGFIADPAILALLESNVVGAPDQARVFTDPNSPVLRELIERAIHVKANVVSQDLYEGGLREILNYGHTLGHAIERQENYEWRHGHAISVGMVFAAELGRLVTGLDAGVVRQHRTILSRLGLPISYQTADRPGLLDAMRIDKKARGNKLRFVVLKDVGAPIIAENPGPELVYAALATVTSEGVRR